MLKIAAQICLLLYFIGILIYFFSMHSKFKEYCVLLAEFEGRKTELEDIRTDEGGMNRFELEAFYGVFKKEVGLNSNEELYRRKSVLRFHFLIAYSLGFIFIFLFVVMVNYKW